MKIPSELLWGLTKNGTSFTVKRKTDTFTKDPCSISNLHNQSDSGIANNQAVSLGLHKKKAKNGHSRVFELRQRYNKCHHNKKLAGVAYSNMKLTKEVHKAAAVIGKLKVTDAKKAKLYQRLYRLHMGNNPQQKQSKKISK